MKIDLYKAYDSIDWSYIHLVLLKTGLPISIIRWIMSCITTIRYAVIVNGLPTTFFEAGRGLRQGCALSPMIFILIMDGFSKIMHKVEQNGFIKGFAFSTTISSTHSLFVDDMLFFGSLIMNHWFYTHYLLIKFGSVTGLCINKQKSILIYEYGDMAEISFIAGFLGVIYKTASEGFKYLGYFIKPCSYKNRD